MKPSLISANEWLKYNVMFLAEHFLGDKLSSILLASRIEELTANIENRLATIPKSSIVNDIPFEEYGKDVIQPPHVPTDKVQVYRQRASNWRCVQNWDLDYFKNHCGDKKFTILNSEGLFERGVQTFGETTMTNYIDQLRSGSKVYLKFSPIIQHDSVLRNDFDESWLEKFTLPTSFGRKYFLFIGGKGTLTPIHNALANTVFVQIYGRKKWTFWAPNQRMFLGVKPERRAYFFSRLQLDQSNSDEFPLSKYATKFEVTLNPGDAIWFPGFFWHHVENLDHSIGVAYKTAHLPSAWSNSSVLTLLTFFATKPFLLDSLIRTGFKNNERVFM